MLPVLKENKLNSKILSWVSLFGSFGTLICCAIPSTLVLLGLGSTVASTLSSFPQLIWFSENKFYVFGFSYLMLALSFFAQKYSQNQSCPVDKKEDCEITKSWAHPLLYISLILNLVGSIYVFILPMFF